MKLDISNFLDEGHQKLFDYWNDKRQKRKAPARKDIDPLEIHSLLPHIFMFDVYRDPLDFKMRLHGTKLAEVMGRDCTGLMFDQIYEGETAEALRIEYTQTAENFEISYSEHSGLWMEKSYVHYRRLLLPLSDDGEVVNILLGCSFFFDE